MNITAQKLHLKTTRYANPHGLADKANHSTAYDIALLSSHVMKNTVFQQIVSSKIHKTNTFYPMWHFLRLNPNHAETPPSIVGKEVPFEVEFGTKFIYYPMTWHNSNRLLTVPGFVGVKTGFTQTAGACLSVYYDNQDCKLITVVLGSRNIEYRWKDAWRLTLWAASVIKKTND